MIRSMMVTELRWDLEKIGKMPWPDVTNLLNYWHKSPPLSQLMNLYLRAKGLVITDKAEPTEFEQMLQDRSTKEVKIDHLPSHVRDLVKEVQEGKHSGRQRR